MQVQTGGASGNNDYYGTSPTWFSGATWSRPIFDGQYVPMGGMVNVIYASCVTFDGLELCHHMANVNFGAGLISGGGTTDNLLITNCYLHGWQLIPSISQDDSHGAVICNFWQHFTNVVLDHCEISNAENNDNSNVATRLNGDAIRQVRTVRFCKIHDTQTAILFAGDVHDNEFYNIDWPVQGFNDSPSGDHPNLCYIAAFDYPDTAHQSAFFYNNLVHDYGNGSSPVYCEVNFSSAGASDCKIYCFNNVVYGHQSAQLAFEIDPEQGVGPAGQVYCYNNTVVNFNANAPGFHVVSRSGTTIGLLDIRNNHIIGSGATVTDAGSGTVQTLILQSNLVQTVSVATGQGYALSNIYAPTHVTAPTVGNGVNLAGLNLFATDRLGNARPGTNGGPWNIGAYEYSGGAGSRPAPPTNLRIVAGP
jgi:hypothetical protein